MIVNLKEQHCENFLQSLHKEQWQEVRLGEVAEMNQKSIDKSYPHKIIQYLDTGSITNNKIESLQLFDSAKLPSRAKRIVQNNDIIYSLVRPIQRHFGFIKNPPENLIVSTGFCVITTNNAILDSKFLYYYLTLNEIIELLDMIAEASTSAYPAIRPFDIENLTIPLPPLTIQQKIAEILSSFDDKIDLLHRQNKTLESLALTLFRHYFIDNPKRDEWEEVSLNSLCEITSSKRIFYSEYVEYGIPFYRSKEIIEFSKGNNPQNELFIDENKYNDIANKFGVPQANDILLTSVGTLGIPYLVPKDKKFYFKDGNLTWFKNFKNITSLFLFYWFKSPQGKEKLDSIAIGSTQQALTITALKAVNIHLPHTDIIRILNEQLNGIQNKIENNTKQIQNLQAMRDILLKAIFE